MHLWIASGKRSPRRCRSPASAPSWTSGPIPGGRTSGGRFGQLVLHGPEGGLRPGRQAELAEDIGDVGPCRSLGDEERRSDLLVAHPLSQQPQDVLLAIGEGLGRVRL